MASASCRRSARSLCSPSPPSAREGVWWPPVRNARTELQAWRSEAPPPVRRAGGATFAAESRRKSTRSYLWTLSPALSHVCLLPKRRHGQRVIGWLGSQSTPTMWGVAMDSNHVERERHSDLAVGRREATGERVRNREG